MNSYLLTWNPKYYDATNDARLVEKRGSASMFWSTNNMKIQPGDPVYLMRQGKEPRGIVATGNAIKHDYHHQDGRWYVPVMWLFFQPEKPFVTLSELKAVFSEQHWSPRGSGILIKEPVAKVLTKMIDEIILKSNDS